MARKNETGKTPAVGAAPRSTPPSLRDLRARIDQLDQDILSLINQRASVAAEIGKAKAENGADVFSPAREEEVLQHVLALNVKNGGPLGSECVRAVFREIMSGSRALQ